MPKFILVGYSGTAVISSPADASAVMRGGVGRMGIYSSKPRSTPDNKEFRRKKALGFLWSIHRATLQTRTGTAEWKKTDALSTFMRLRDQLSLLLWDLQNGGQLLMPDVFDLAHMEYKKFLLSVAGV